MKIKYLNKIIALILLSFFIQSKDSKAHPRNLNATLLNNTSYKYFYHLPFRESPYKSFTGIHPTTKKEAFKRNHFRFTYNKQNKLTEIIVMREGKMVVNSISNDFFMGVAKVTIEYQPQKEILRYFNFKNERIDFGGIWKAEYNLDANGKRKNLKYYNQENEETENRWGICKYEWEIDKDNRVKEQRFNLKGEQAMIRPRFDFYEVRLEYDKNGYLKAMYNYGTGGKLTDNSTGVAMDKLIYNEKGDFLGWRVFNKDKKAVIGNLPGTAGGNHFYNQFGDQYKTETIALNGGLMMSNWGNAIQSREYDTNGNASVLKIFNEKREQIPPFNTNVYTVKFKFNKWNLRTKTEYFDKDGNLTNDGDQNVALGTYKYDKRKNMIEMRYFDKDGNLTFYPRRNGAIIKFIRDYKNNTIDTLRYNTEKEIINSK